MAWAWTQWPGSPVQWAGYLFLAGIVIGGLRLGHQVTDHLRDTAIVLMGILWLIIILLIAVMAFVLVAATVGCGTSTRAGSSSRCRTPG